MSCTLSSIFYAPLTPNLMTYSIPLASKFYHYLHIVRCLVIHPLVLASICLFHPAFMSVILPIQLFYILSYLPNSTVLSSIILFYPTVLSHTFVLSEHSIKPFLMFYPYSSTSPLFFAFSLDPVSFVLSNYA